MSSTKNTEGVPSSSNTRIIIKIKDEYFLTKKIYESFKDNLILNQTIFNEWNLKIINELYPEVKFERSETIFENLFNELAGLSNSFVENFVLESQFSVIDNTYACNLMLEAYKRADYKGENILNYFFIETSTEKAHEVLSRIKRIENSGITCAYIRGELVGSIARQPISIKSVNDEVIKDIDDLFWDYGVKDIISNNTRIVDVEQAWDFNNSGISRLNLSNKPILGGGHNFPDSRRDHGTNTLNVLFGEEIRPDSSTLNGLCKGDRDNVRVASVWFNGTDENCEAALVSLFRVEFDANGNRIKDVDILLNVGDIVLLELQLTIPGDGEPFPIEIERARFNVIKLGIQAGFIIIEAAGNGKHNLDKPQGGCYVDLSKDSSGAIMVGAIEKTDSDLPLRHPNTNYGKRVDTYCYGNNIHILNGMTYNSTSLATSVIAALAANLQKKAKTEGKVLNIVNMKRYLSSGPDQLPKPGTTFGISSNRNINNINMENKRKLSHQGLRELEFEPAKLMKQRFRTDFVDKLPTGPAPLVATGYFIGKVLLNRILTENEDAAGIIFSFGLNKPVAEGGQLHLILEVASGVEVGNIPNFIVEREIYATGKPGDGGPDDVIPAIKPTPPPPPR